MKHTAALVAAIALMAGNAFAQSPAPNPLSGAVRIRIENWNWFETAGADDRYTFLGAQLRLAYTKKWGTIEAEVPVLLNLPEDAVRPAPRGQLGFGGSYYAANNESNTAGLILKQAYVKAGSFRIGRWEFTDGMEHMPSDPTLAMVRTSRISNRLVGTFRFSHVERSFDGVHFDRGPWTVLAARPTAGVLRVDAAGPLDVGLLYGSWTHSTANGDGRVFFIGYRDHRDDIVKVDNRPAAIRSADRDDIRVSTIGGHYIAKLGGTNLLAWIALQGGDWGTQEHHAGALDLEAATHIGPANVRAGWFRSSGDDDPADGDHETFFQILPTARSYARFPFYNAMNSDDRFLSATFRPTPKLTLQSDLHRLSLTEKADLWYSGGGAFDGLAFGFSGRTSSGHDDLATVIDLSADYKLNPTTTLTFYAGRAAGGDVVEAIYDGDKAVFAYFEVLKRF